MRKLGEFVLKSRVIEVVKIVNVILKFKWKRNWYDEGRNSNLIEIIECYFCCCS